MKKILLAIVSYLTCAEISQASHIFYLEDINTGKVIVSEGDLKASLSPCSTFKIPLALMGFESKILVDQNNPEWKFVPEKHGKAAVVDHHKQDMTPQKWMTYSAVWYSQEMTVKLGNEAFKNYVERLFGNVDISGDPGKNNGLTHCWLGSSLKVTPAQQVELLKKLMQKQLPFSVESQEKTRLLIALPDDINGWKLFGKTGSGYEKNADGTKNEKLMHGWFIGWLEKDEKKIVFVYHQSNIDTEGGRFGGPVAKIEAIERLKKIL